LEFAVADGERGAIGETGKGAADRRARCVAADDEAGADAWLAGDLAGENELRAVFRWGKRARF
jgi:hypothetical protein